MKNDYKFFEKEGYVSIFLKNRKKEILETLIDIEDFEKVNGYEGTFSQKFDIYTNGFYAVICLYQGMVGGKPKYKNVRLNRIVMNCYDKRKVVDHIYGDTLDNRKRNLRITSVLTNSQNRQRINSNNTSGYRNVCYIQGFWRVQLQINKKNHLFQEKFKDVHEAGKFAEKMRLKYYNK